MTRILSWCVRHSFCGTDSQDCLLAANSSRFVLCSMLPFTFAVVRRTVPALGIVLDSTNDHKRDGLPEPFVFTMGDQCTCSVLTPHLPCSNRYALHSSASALPCDWEWQPASCRARLDGLVAPLGATGSGIWHRQSFYVA